jgi:hypothetical protein
MWQCSQTLRPSVRFSITNYHFYQTDLFLGRKYGTAVAVRQGISNSHADLPFLALTGAIKVCKPIRRKEFQLAVLYKSSGGA